MIKARFTASATMPRRSVESRHGLRRDPFHPLRSIESDTIFNVSRFLGEKPAGGQVKARVSCAMKLNTVFLDPFRAVTALPGARNDHRRPENARRSR